MPNCKQKQTSQKTETTLPSPQGLPTDTPLTQERVYREACRHFLPTSRQEMDWLGWDQLDVLLITGDAYVDHPTFGMACLGRWLERLGLRVGICAQPRWDSTVDLLEFGRPRLFVGVSSGTVDSMINNYTANKKVRSDDQYSEGGIGGRRPDYGSVVYSKLARAAFPETPVLVGGVEASLRRLAHYDYWQNCVRPSIVTELAAELLVFGMGERTTTTLVNELQTALKISQAAGRSHLSIKDQETQEAFDRLKTQRGVAFLTSKDHARSLEGRITIPSFEEVRDDKKKFAKAAYFIEYEASPYNGKRLVQYHGNKAVVVNPPALPLSTQEMDSIYEMKFTKEQHPRYKARVPAADMIRFSVASTRGCFGGCSFCAITLHQGRIVQSRSEESILGELQRLNQVSGFKGIVSDIGGPTANMYQLSCKSPEIQSQCRKLSCVHPRVCPHLQKNHGAQISLLRKARKIPGIRKIHIASGLRFDLSISDKENGQEYMRELITHHVGGHLKVAPEHLDEEVLHLMKKPGLRNFDEFVSYFKQVSAEIGKEQYIVPYFISGFPGTTHEKMEKVTTYLKEKGWNLQQVQGFIPTPMALATAMYWTGMDPMTKKPLFVAKSREDRQVQQALLQPHKPKNREVLRRFQRNRPNPERTFSNPAGRAQKSLVQPPAKKMGPKLLLDTR